MRKINYILNKNNKNTKFYLIAVIIIIIFNVSIILDVPIIRQIIAFAILSVLPGLFILASIGLINKLELCEMIILSIGLSVSFLMIIGILLDFTLTIIKFNQPLSLYPLLITFDAVLVALIIFTSLRNIKIKLDLFINSISRVLRQLSYIEKIIMIVPVYTFLLSLIGVTILNKFNVNTILIIFYLLIFIYISLISIISMKIKINSNIYPFIIFFLSLSLILVLPLRSDYILGMDTHYEFYLFQLTYDMKHFEIHNLSSMDSCLSITILPTIYKIFTNINSQLLFKLLYPILFSIFPIVVYLISNKFIKESYAFISSCLFMSHYVFLYAEANARAILAIFFFGLSIFTLFNNNINNINKKLLFIIFVVSSILSHYTTSCIFLLILILSWIILKVLKKILKENSYVLGNIITTKNIAIFSLILFFWYSQVTNVPFKAIVNLSNTVLKNLSQLFVLDLKGEGVSHMLGKNISNICIPRMIEIISIWAVNIFIVVGILYSLLCVVQKYNNSYNNSKIGNNKIENKIEIDLNKKEFIEFLAISLSCVIILLVAILLPYVTKIYSAKRLSFQMYVVLSPFFVIGGIELSKKLRLRYNWILVITGLALFYLSTTGITYQAYNIPYKVTLNNCGFEYKYLYIHTQENYAARWIGEHINRKDTEICTDFSGGYRLLSQAGIGNYSTYDNSLFTIPKYKCKYIYLRYYNVVNNKVIANQYVEYELSKFIYKFKGMNKVYDNGGSEFWMKT